MKLPTQLTGLGTMGLTGIVLMYLHITGSLVGWAWPVLYLFLIIGGIGQENTKK